MDENEETPTNEKDSETVQVIRQQVKRRPKDLGRDPQEITCKNCGKTGTTLITRHNGPCVWLSVFVLVFLFIPFFWVPFVFPRCKDVLHTCPECGAEIGLYTFF